MSEKILTDWQKKKYKPVYWLEGDEEYFIDQLVNYAESNILSQSEAEFNLTIFYGRDTLWTDVVNACRRYPMFAERQVVLLKEAQHMRDVDKLLGYIEKSSASTVLVVSYKGKKYDGKTKFAKSLKQHAEVFTTKKIYDNQLPSWVDGLVKSKGFSMNQKALTLLVDHIGNDLSRIANELDKVIINLGSEKIITDDHIERFVGVSKEYNIFELQDALGKKDLAKAMRIIQYFESNPKAAPMPLLLGTMYNFFSKIYTIFGMNDKSEEALLPVFYYNKIAVKQALQTAMKYDLSGIEKAIMLLHEYNLKNIGIRNSGTPEGSLLKELAYKIVYM